jgi:hypothetical protein
MVLFLVMDLVLAPSRTKLASCTSTFTVPFEITKHCDKRRDFLRLLLSVLTSYGCKQSDGKSEVSYVLSPTLPESALLTGINCAVSSRGLRRVICFHLQGILINCVRSQ